MDKKLREQQRRKTCPVPDGLVEEILGLTEKKGSLPMLTKLCQDFSCVDCRKGRCTIHGQTTPPATETCTPSAEETSNKKAWHSYMNLAHLDDSQLRQEIPFTSSHYTTNDHHLNNASSMDNLSYLTNFAVQNCGSEMSLLGNQVMRQHNGSRSLNMAVQQISPRRMVSS